MIHHRPRYGTPQRRPCVGGPQGEGGEVPIPFLTSPKVVWNRSSVSANTRLVIVDRHLADGAGLPGRAIVAALEPDLPVLIDGAHAPGMLPPWGPRSLLLRREPPQWVCAQGAALRRRPPRHDPTSLVSRAWSGGRPPAPAHPVRLDGDRGPLSPPRRARLSTRSSTRTAGTGAPAKRTPSSRAPHRRSPQARSRSREVDQVDGLGGAARRPNRVLLTS